MSLPATASAVCLDAPAEPVSLSLEVPLLREELRLLPASANSDGSPAWLIHDPVSNKFYRISWLDFEMLIRWPQRMVDAIVDSVHAETTLNIDADSVMHLVAFLRQHHLIQSRTVQEVSLLMGEAERRKVSALTWLLHHYLFFRIPLIRPQKLLQQCLRFLNWVYTPATALGVLIVTLAGVFLAARQWDTFSATFFDQLTVAGVFSYGAALVFSKCLHELGHALTATRHGVRVGHMGVAMVVMFPMPYTDTSESWKLSNNMKRLQIASAGIITELGLAGVATFGWSLCPDGPVRSALFFLATTSWLLTLAVNASPFMRFDGYYILSDLLDFPNLHERAGELAKTGMRRFLLGFRDPWPEELSERERRFLTVFSMLTFIYRMTVYIGIAWVVYYAFFKALGIILFAVEVIWFICLPFWREFKVWYARRSEIRPDRISLFWWLLGGLLMLGMIPWHMHVSSPGWIHAASQHTVFTPVPGTLQVMHKGGKVRKGESLFVLTSPSIALQALHSQSKAQTSESQLRSLTGLEDGESRRATLQVTQEKFSAEVKLYRDELDRMDLTAPFDGVLLDIDEQLSVGTWVHPRSQLAVLIDPETWVADAFVPESEIDRIKLNNKADIYLMSSHLSVFSGRVIEIDKGKLSVLPSVVLDAQHGGPIPTLGKEGTQGKSVPAGSYYRVRIAFDGRPEMDKTALCEVRIDAQGSAWLPVFFSRLASLFVRETGF